jgi:hypothetical protein
MANASRVHRSKLEYLAPSDHRWAIADEVARNPHYLSAQVQLDGEERFNFPQRVTLYPGVLMRTRSSWGPELETLAVNLLLHSKPAWQHAKTPEAARRLTQPWAELFAVECLAPYAGHSWVMTTSMVVATLRCIGQDRRRRGSKGKLPIAGAKDRTGWRKRRRPAANNFQGPENTWLPPVATARAR